MSTEETLEQVRRALDGLPLTAPAPEIAVRIVDLRIRSAAAVAALRGTEAALVQAEEQRDTLNGELMVLRQQAEGRAS